MGYSALELDLVFERSCHLCGGACRRSHYGRLDSRYGWEVDHDIPRALGGEHALENLRTAHPSCNRSKGALLSDEFRELLEEAKEAPAVPIATVSVGVGLFAAAAQKDPQKKLETGLKWGLGTLVFLSLVHAASD